MGRRPASSQFVLLLDFAVAPALVASPHDPDTGEVPDDAGLPPANPLDPWGLGPWGCNPDEEPLQYALEEHGEPDAGPEAVTW